MDGTEVLGDFGRAEEFSVLSLVVVVVVVLLLLFSSTFLRAGMREERRLVSEEARLSERRLDWGLESEDAKDVKSVETLTGSLNFRVVEVPLVGEVGEGVELLLDTEDQE